MRGNRVIGILSESCNKWERRVPLTPSHCAKLLHRDRDDKNGVNRIIIQPSTKRVFHDTLYEDVGCEISNDLSECGLILGIKQPQLDMILPDATYAFFSHTHKAQTENMPLLDKILQQRASLYDYELMVGEEDGKRLLSFGKFAGRAGFIDFLHGLGKRYLNLGFSTPFLSLGTSYMYTSLSAAKAAVISVGEEITTSGLPHSICPLVFVFTGSGNASMGAQEIFKLLPHAFVDPKQLPELHLPRKSGRGFQLYGCVVGCEDMVERRDGSKPFDRDENYVHPDLYSPTFHHKIAPYASVIVNCIYWERRFPRLLTTNQLQLMTLNGSHLVGVSDISCDIGGSLEFVDRTSSLDSPFYRYDPSACSYHHDMEGDGIICSAVDILPTQFAKEASHHFGDVLSQLVPFLSSEPLLQPPVYLSRACIVRHGRITPLYEYIPRMKNTTPRGEILKWDSKPEYRMLLSLSGHLFDQFLINEALDIIEAAGGSFSLVKCHLGQSSDATSYSELEVTADDNTVLEHIAESLTCIPKANPRPPNSGESKLSLRVDRQWRNNSHGEEQEGKKVLILGAGRVCRPAVGFLANFSEENGVYIGVVVGSLHLKDAEEAVEMMPNCRAIRVDVGDEDRLREAVAEADIVASLLPPACHGLVVKVCVEMGRHVVTASYADGPVSAVDSAARKAGVTVLCEMGLDPGIDHMMAMKMVDEAHADGGRVRSFVSYCGGLPSPACSDNPLAYKFSWNPAGAIRAGSNPAVYKAEGETVHVEGGELYASARRVRLPGLTAFALECLPNRNSLAYGRLYGIADEASTVFRGTLRYEGFSEAMGVLARAGFFDQGRALPERRTFRAVLSALLQTEEGAGEGRSVAEQAAERFVALGHCGGRGAAARAGEVVAFVGYEEEAEVPGWCESVFDATCVRMEEKMCYSEGEEDVVILQHEAVVEYGGGATAVHRSTLLDFGGREERGGGRRVSGMARCVGIPVGIGVLLLLQGRIGARGVVRPTEPEVYAPALDILRACGFRMVHRRE